MQISRLMLVFECYICYAIKVNTIKKLASQGTIQLDRNGEINKSRATKVKLQSWLIDI